MWSVALSAPLYDLLTPTNPDSIENVQNCRQHFLLPKTVTRLC